MLAQKTVTEGVEVVALELLLPHELKKAREPASASEKRSCFRLGLRPPESNFGSSTRRSPCVMPDSKSLARQNGAVPAPVWGDASHFGGRSIGSCSSSGNNFVWSQKKFHTLRNGSIP